MKLEVKNLVKKFKSTIAVNNISLEIEKNNTLGLLGPNGCGKTTSIGMMLGLITPTSGEIFIDGIKLNSENRINLLSLMNFASPYVELPKKLTVRQNLEVYARLYGVSNKVEGINKIAEKEGFSLQNVLYVGNDLNDYQVMQLCGHTACPADSHIAIKGISDIVLKTKGGEGVVREILEDIFKLNFVKILFK